MKKLAVLFTMLMLMIPFSSYASWDITGTDGRSYNLDELGKGITLSHTLNINPDAAEIPGVQYHSIAHALTYIAAQTPVPSATNRWGLLVSGTLDENIDLANMTYIHIVGTKNAVLTGTIDNSATDAGGLGGMLGKIPLYPLAIMGVTINNLSLSHSSLLVLYDCIVSGGSSTDGVLVIQNSTITGGTFCSYVTSIFRCAVLGGTFGDPQNNQIILIEDTEALAGTFDSVGIKALNSSFVNLYFGQLQIKRGAYSECTIGRNSLIFTDGAYFVFFNTYLDGDTNMSVDTVTSGDAVATEVTMELHDMHYSNITIGEGNSLQVFNCVGGQNVNEAGGEWAIDNLFIGDIEATSLVIPEGTPVNAIAASVTLTASNIPVNADTVTIDSVGYAFVDTLSETPSTCEVKIVSGNVNTTLANLGMAINLNGTDGTNYKNCSLHPTVAATAGTGTLLATAKTRGVSGNYTGVSSSNPTNLTWSGSTLSGGVNGTVGKAGETYRDSSYIYNCIADNTISGANWRRVSLGTAY